MGECRGSDQNRSAVEFCTVVPGFGRFCRRIHKRRGGAEAQTEEEKNQ
jgi:hypothetical protein